MKIKCLFFYKRQLFPLFLLAFLSSLLITCLFVGKDSFYASQEQAALEFDGDWELHYYLSTPSDKLPKHHILTQLTTDEIEGLPIVYSSNIKPFPIRLIKGRLPNKNEVVIESELAKRKQLHLGDSIGSYQIVGIVKNRSNLSIRRTLYAPLGKHTPTQVYANLVNPTLQASEDYELNQSLLENRYQLNPTLNLQAWIGSLLLLFLSFIMLRQSVGLCQQKLHRFEQATHYLGLNPIQWIIDIPLILGLFLGLVFALLTSWISFSTIHYLSFSIRPLHALILLIYISLLGLSPLHKRAFHFSFPSFKKECTHGYQLGWRLIRSGHLFTKYTFILLVNALFIFYASNLLHQYQTKAKQLMPNPHQVSGNITLQGIKGLETIQQMSQYLTKPFQLDLSGEAILDDASLPIQIKNQSEPALLTGSQDTVVILLYPLDFTIPITPVYQYSNELSFSISLNQAREWLKQYPNIYIHASFIENTTHPDQLSQQLESHTYAMGEVHIINHAKQAREIQKTLFSITFLCHLGAYLLTSCALIIFILLMIHFFQFLDPILATLHLLGMGHQTLLRTLGQWLFVPILLENTLMSFLVNPSLVPWLVIQILIILITLLLSIKKRLVQY